jgi:hypothetical protein
MARRRSAWNQVRRDMYYGQRTMGDLSAARRGGRPLAKRLVRRSLTRQFFRALRQMSR